MKDTILTLISIALLATALALLGTVIISENGATILSGLLITVISAFGILVITTLVKTCHFKIFD